jgi:hypothetical protein
MLVILTFITFYLKDISKNGRFQSSGEYGGTILDTRTGQTFTIQYKNIDMDSSNWELIPHTKLIIKE